MTVGCGCVIAEGGVLVQRVDGCTLEHVPDYERLAASPPAQAQELTALKAWRDTVTAALRIEGGCRFEDVTLLNQLAEALGVGDGDCEWDSTELLEAARKAGNLLERGALPPPHGWQPIEAAPKDGTPLLIWADGKHIVHLFWKSDHWEWLGGGRCPDGQYRMTHWMPLPAPPVGRPTETPDAD